MANVMHRYVKSSEEAFLYTGKDAGKDFISDICEELQYIKKNLGAKSSNFRMVANLDDMEYWWLSIKVDSDGFIVNDCQMTSGGMQDMVRLCNKYLNNGCLNNYFRNITEFRRFLKAHVMKK